MATSARHSAAEAPNIDRPTSASELVEYVLYWYAMGHFLWFAADSYGNYAKDWSITGTYLLVVLFFTFVLLRNYLVMHAIDTAAHRHDSRFNFLAGNDKAGDVGERVLRFAILLTVIVTPKGAFPPAEAVIGFCAKSLEQALAFGSSAIGLSVPHSFPEDSFVHATLPYYGTVLLILFIEFLAWDMINVRSLANRTRAGKVLLEVDFEKGEIEDPAYRSMLRYFNICRKRHWTSRSVMQPDGSKYSRHSIEEAVYFEPNYLEGKPVQMIQSGAITGLYLLSPKFWERLFGIFTAVMFIFVAVSEFSVIVVALCAISAVLYAIFALRNENYVVGMAGHWRLPLSYIISGYTPYP